MFRKARLARDPVCKTCPQVLTDGVADRCQSASAPSDDSLGKVETARSNEFRAFCAMRPRRPISCLAQSIKARVSREA